MGVRGRRGRAVPGHRSWLRLRLLQLQMPRRHRPRPASPPQPVLRRRMPQGPTCTHTHTQRRTQTARDSERLHALPAPITTIDKKGARAANQWVKLALVKAKRASGDFMLASLYEGTRPDGAAVLETERQRQTGRQADRETERQRQTGRQADRETERQVQAGRHAETNTHSRAVNRDRPDAAARGAAAALQATVLSSMCANLQISSR